ncbi:MAG: hypothetical protein EBS89_06875 [Proteobacteria bacterium]|nr:hypothetical protein [Pseudomonadota bacterium]
MDGDSSASLTNATNRAGRHADASRTGRTRVIHVRLGTRTVRGGTIWCDSMSGTERARLGRSGGGRSQHRGTPTADRPMTLKWLAIAIGVAVAYGLQVGGGYLAASVGIVRDPSAELAGEFSALPILQFASLTIAAYVAGRLAGVAGFLNGVAVGVAFIVVWAALNAYQESELVREFGPLALPAMNLPGVVLGDALILSSAAFGGWLSDRWTGE